MVYPALLPLMRTRRLPVVDSTDAPTDLNGLVRFAERRNLVSARVPSHFNWPLLNTVDCSYNTGALLQDQANRRLAKDPTETVERETSQCVRGLQATTPHGHRTVEALRTPWAS